MNHNGRADYGAIQKYASFDEAIPLPTPMVVEQPAQQQPSPAHDAIVGKTVTWANLGVTAIIIVAMLRDGSKVQTALIVGSCYFALATGLYVLTTSGTLTAIVNVWQSQRTERRRIDAYQELGVAMLEWRMMQEQALAERRPSTASVHRLSPLGDSPNYVTPYLDGEQAAVEAVRFVTSLYDANGLPNRRKVHPDGRLAVRMPGSKRGGGSREAGLWLLRNGVIRRVERGYALDLLAYPTVDRVRRLL